MASLVMEVAGTEAVADACSASASERVVDGTDVEASALDCSTTKSESASASESISAGKDVEASVVLTLFTDADPANPAKRANPPRSQAFRNYTDSGRQSVVQRHYRLMRSHQTLAFARRMGDENGKFNHAKMTIRDAFRVLETYVDSSDPDSELPNLQHMMQTAERVRADGHPDWFQLTALLHDMGKLQFQWGKREDGQQGTADGDQWALGGDTWVVGCRIPDTVVFPEFSALNPDMRDPVLSSEMGVYAEGCGLDALVFAWGHDEYMYRVLKHNQSTIPEQGLAMIRLHSCYPWHEHGEYERFVTAKDVETKRWVKLFNQYDLYTKSDDVCDVEELWPYYQGLIDKYCPGELEW